MILVFFGLFLSCVLTLIGLVFSCWAGEEGLGEILGLTGCFGILLFLTIGSGILTVSLL